MTEDEAKPDLKSMIVELMSNLPNHQQGLTLTELKTMLLNIGAEDADTKDVHNALSSLQKQSMVTRDSVGKIYWTGPSSEGVKLAKSVSARMDDTDGCNYHDHAMVLPILNSFYNIHAPVIIIGPHGTGKTDAIREFCRQRGLNLYTVPCSLGLREHNFVGHLTKEKDNIMFKKGPVPLSMEDEKGVLYLDELNAAEADVLLRLDEVLDGRKEVNYEGTIVRASENWWCVASINPLDHAGTKELPNQIMSRFFARIHLTYPLNEEDEVEISLKALKKSKHSVNANQLETIRSVISCIRNLRDKSLDLPYSPSLRESIACANLIILGMPLALVTKHVIITPYYQWGQVPVGKVADYLTSKLGKENVAR